MKLKDDQNIDKVYLHPAEICICEKPTQVVTVLGSCVSVTLFHPVSRMAAICHGTLPRCRSGMQCRKPCIDAFKYVDCAIYFMLRKFRAAGIKDRDIAVKLFGGADTLLSKSSNTIGSQNVKAALEVIEAEKLRVIAADVGDAFGRKLIFHSDTGDVFIKRLKNGMVRERK